MVHHWLFFFTKGLFHKRWHLYSVLYSSLMMQQWVLIHFCTGFIINSCLKLSVCLLALTGALNAVMHDNLPGKNIVLLPICFVALSLSGRAWLCTMLPKISYAMAHELFRHSLWGRRGEERRGDCLIRHSLASWNRIWGKRTPIPSFPDHGSHYFLQAANKSRPCDLQKWKKKKRSTCCLDWCWREGWAAWQRRLNQDSPPDRISLDGQTAPIWLDTEFF